MPNVGDIIRAKDFSGSGIKAGAVMPFYNVTLSGRHPIFWGEYEADTSWLVCDGGDDLHGGNVPDLRNRFIMGVVSVDEANITGGSTTTSETTLTGSTSGTHQHYVAANVRSTWPGYGITRSQYISRTNYNGGDGLNTEYAFIGTGNVASVGLTSISTGGSGAHTHTLTPPYYTLIFCVKLP